MQSVHARNSTHDTTQTGTRFHKRPGQAVPVHLECDIPTTDSEPLACCHQSNDVEAEFATINLSLDSSGWVKAALKVHPAPFLSHLIIRRSTPSLAASALRLSTMLCIPVMIPGMSWKAS